MVAISGSLVAGFLVTNHGDRALGTFTMQKPEFLK